MLEVEDVEKYAPAGYHPVDIGDELGPEDSHRLRYTVLHKLGAGGFSTVWLVKSGFPDMRYFALKVLCADASGAQGRELRFLQHLRDGGHGHPNVVMLHDSFEVSGPNGTHTCLVLPVLGPSLDNSRVEKNFPADTRYRVWHFYTSWGSVMAVRYASPIIMVFQLIRRADLTPSNVVFELPDVSFLSSSQVCDMLGPIKTEKLRLPGGIYSPHAPKRVVQHPDFSGLSFPASFLRLNIQTVDLGEAFFASQPRSFLGVPLSYFPPEICFGYSPSTMSDV